jgi:hypothetical protein
VFYPAANDAECKSLANTGFFGINFYPYGYENVFGANKAQNARKNEHIRPYKEMKWAFMPLMRTQQKFWRNRKLGKRDPQVIVFSHGSFANRMTYSSVCGELASYGYLVITILHNDGSPDFSPYTGAH